MATELATALESKRASISSVIPKTIGIRIDAERLIKTCLLAVSKTPLLRECSQESILKCVMTAAQLGLDCSGVTGEAFMVPFKDKTGQRHAQFILGYRGMIALANRSGDVAKVDARAVYEGEQFEVEYGSNEHILHRPDLDGQCRVFRLAYAIATLRDGRQQIAVMPKWKIDAIRGRSRAGDNGPWVTDYDEMAAKTAVRLLYKKLNISIDVMDAIKNSDDNEFGPDARIDDPEPTVVPSGTAGVRQALARTKKVTSTAAPEPAPEPTADENPPQDPPSDQGEQKPEQTDDKLAGVQTPEQLVASCVRASGLQGEDSNTIASAVRKWLNVNADKKNPIGSERKRRDLFDACLFLCLGENGVVDESALASKRAEAQGR